MKKDENEEKIKMNIIENEGKRTTQKIMKRK